MPCALPPVDQAASQLGWGDGTFLGPRGSGVRPVTHSGIDFMADVGSPVVAPWAGTVVAKGREDFGGTAGFSRDALGYYVVVAHGVVEARQNPVWTRYGHLRAESALAIGARVNQGDLLGYVGTSGLAPENRGRPRLFFQTFTYESGATNPRSPGTDPLDRFFRPLGVQHEGGETPGPSITPYDQVPPWGGRLVQQDACESSTGTAGFGFIDPRRKQTIYSRFGHTQLTGSRAPYAPAVYSSSTSGGGSSGVVLAVTGAVAAGAWWLSRRRQIRTRFAGAVRRNERARR